jgi:hypothetical protein
MFTINRLPLDFFLDLLLSGKPSISVIHKKKLKKKDKTVEIEHKILDFVCRTMQ